MRVDRSGVGRGIYGPIGCGASIRRGSLGQREGERIRDRQTDARYPISVAEIYPVRFCCVESRPPARLPRHPPLELARRPRRPRSPLHSTPPLRPLRPLHPLHSRRHGFPAADRLDRCVFPSSSCLSVLSLLFVLTPPQTGPTSASASARSTATSSPTTASAPASGPRPPSSSRPSSPSTASPPASTTASNATRASRPSAPPTTAISTCSAPR